METTLKKQPARKNTKTQQPFGKRLTVDEFRREAFADLNSGDISLEELREDLNKTWNLNLK